MPPAPLGRGGRATAAGGVLCAAIAILTALPGGAGAAFRTGFQEDQYVTGDTALREALFDRTVAANASVVRINVIWRSLVASPPANPSDPADPAYRFRVLDEAVQAAARRGLRPLLTINDAPYFAEGPGGPADPNPDRVGSWRPDPAALAAFSRAVATRYSGGFGGLPRVRDFQIWNEPNLSVWLSPQREGEREVSPDHYREMLNAAYSAIKGVHADNQVVSAGTAPYGDDRGDKRVRPLEFLRKLLCLRDNLERRCKQKAKFDILAHHPITYGPPRDGAIHRDDATTSDFDLVVRTLRAAERANTVTKGRHEAWATEIWWETNPPDPNSGQPLAKHARWLQQALFILWRQGADVVLNFRVQDEQDVAARLQSGVYFASGEPKPSATAWAFPFVGNRKSSRRVEAWGKAPVGGELRIQRLANGGWRKVGRVSVDAGEVFTAKLSIRGATQLRAKVGGQTSLAWRQR
jgi:hypothetical protein